jgi:predicted dehydrogenase
MDERLLNRRNFIGTGAAAFTILKPDLVRGAGKENLKAGLIGCGKRGTTAAFDLLTANENVELVAMADLDPEHLFSGFDAYKKLIASDVDVVLLCTAPGYRPIHFEVAVNAGKHVFAEKPVATDPVGARRFMAAAARKAEQLKLTVVSGAQRHYFAEFVET